jgi:phospholipase A1
MKSISAWFSFLSLALSLLLTVHSASEAAEDGYHLINLEHYQPIYFVSGVPDTKIQLSFKAKLIESSNLYLGYTQLMMWEIFNPNPYFRDLNYDPDLFYRQYFGGVNYRWLDIGGFEHESNGKGGVDERSWNRTYLRYHDRFNLGQRTKVYWSVKAWVPYVYGYYTHDILQYRGLYECELTIEDFLGNFLDPSDITFRFYGGGKSYVNPLQGGQEITFRSKVSKAAFLPLFVLEVFHGYGENLYNYRDNRFGLRAGIGL